MTLTMKSLHRRHILLALVGSLLLPAHAQRVLPALERPALVLARPAQSVLLAVTRTGSRLVACGERGLVLVSDNSGATWTQSKVPVSVTLTALRFRNEREGWAVGNMGVVLRTLDAGNTWERVLDGRTAALLAQQAAQAAWDAVKPDPGALEHPLNLALDNAQRLVAEGADKPLLDLAVGKDGSVTAVGAYGLAMSSSDSGAHWHATMNELPNPEGLTLNGMVERAGEKLIYGESGLLLRAAGADPVYRTQALSSSGSLFGALALREGPLLLLGLRGKVLRSAAPGASWTEIQTPVDASLFAGVQTADGSVMLVGAAGQLLISRDQGQSYTALPMKTRFPFTGAVIAPDGALILAGTRGVLRLEARAPAVALPANKTSMNTNSKEARNGQL